MNPRQRAFAEHYAACGNAAEAARKAGYSERTARSQGQRLLTNADILEYIGELQSENANARIATMGDVKAFWSRIMNDADARTADRLRASELLAKAAGAFVASRSDDGADYGYGAEPDTTNDDVIIYLPANGRDQHLQKFAEG